MMRVLVMSCILSCVVVSGCLTKAPTNQPTLLEPIVSTGMSSGIQTYTIVTGDSAILTDSLIKPLLTNISAIQQNNLIHVIPDINSGSMEISTSSLLVRVIKGSTPGQETLEIQDSNKKHSAEFPYVEANRKMLTTEECRGEQIFKTDDLLCNMPRVMWLYGPFFIGGASMIIYTLSDVSGILTTRAVSLSTYKDLPLPFRPQRYNDDQSLLIARQGSGKTYRFIWKEYTGGSLIANGQQIDGYSVSSGRLYAYQFNNESENNSSTLWVIDIATNTILHTLNDIDIGQESFFLQDEKNPDIVYVRYTKTFFTTEQQKDYIMKLDLTNNLIERLVQL